MPVEAKVEAEKVVANMEVAEDPPHEVTKAEIEVDAAADKRPKLTSPVDIDTNDCSMNVMPSCGGKVLLTLADGGLHYLCGAARANTGVKAGRYLFEVKIVEGRDLQASGNQRAAGHSLHIGISGAGSSLFLAHSPSSCCFSNDGMFMQGSWKAPKGKTFKPFDVVGLLINVDAKSSNKNTASLFINGVRASDPQPIPEALHGKPLFPTINFKNLTLHVNMGPDSLAAMPFTCRMVQDAAQKDVEVTAKKTGKKEVLFPVGIPNEGTFRFLDSFLEANPGYTELSDRAVVNWARASDVWPVKTRNTSNDRPGLDFGVQEMEERGLRKSLASAASYHERNYVVMEVKGNLLSEERKKAVAQYDGNSFKRVAVVAMGEPPKAFKEKVQKEILEHKQWMVAAEVKKTKEVEAKEKAAAKAAKEKEKAKAAKEKAAAKEQAAKEKAKAKAEKKAKAEADKKAAEKAEKEKAVDISDDDGEKKAVDLDEDDKEKKVEEKADEESEEPEKDEESAAEEEAAEEPEESLEEAIAKAQKAIELTDEEEEMWFPKGEYAPHPDLTSKELGSSFSSFSIPTKEEGFDEVRFVWGNVKKSEEHLQAWIKEKKLTQKVEDLAPGTWFKDQLAQWQKLCDSWRDRQRDWNDPSKRERKKATAAQKRKAKDEDDGEGKENKENNDNVEEEEDEAMKDDFDANDIDAFDAEDVDDLGNGEPLYAHFAYEDWTLMSLRFELHLLVHGFVTDMNDAERPLHDSLVGFYFKKYFKKDLNLKLCNRSSLAELMELIPDVLEVCQSSTLGPLLANDSPMDNFLRMTEDARRERLKLIDAGDESAVLKFDRRQAVQQDRGGGKGNKSGGGKGGGKSGDRSGHGGKPAPAPTGRMSSGGTSRIPLGRATYGAPAARVEYGQGPPQGMGHGPLGPPSYGPGPSVGYGPGPGRGPVGYGPPPGGPPGYGPPPGPGYGAPPGYGPPPGYGAPAPRYGMGPPPGAYGPPPGQGFSPHGQKRGGSGMPSGGPPDSRRRVDDRGAFRGGGGRR